VDEKRVGWVRGIHITERKRLDRWYTGKEYVENVLLLATTLSREEILHCTGREVYQLAKLVKEMTEFDLSLAPYLTAFVSTSTSEFLWHGKGLSLTAFENKIVQMPDGSTIKIMTPSHHARLWGTLCTYREQNKTRLDGMMNATMIVRPWAGKGIDSFTSELRVAMRNLTADAVEPWERVVSTVTSLDVNDGWGHPEDTTTGLLRELKGMISHDRHEQVMDAFMRQQIAVAEAEALRIENLHKSHGGPGVTQKEGFTILTPQQVQEREQRLKKGISVRDTEVYPKAGERIKRYQ
jgi:hypothetical protein